MNPVKIAVVGFGQFGRLHAQSLDALSETQLVGIVDARQEAIERAADQFPHVPRWHELARALEQCDAEAWVIASSTASHVSLASAVLAAGRTALVEKPLACSLAEAESLAPQVAPDSRNLMLAHIVLFNSEFRQLAAEVRNRGPVTFIDCVRHRPTGTMRAFPGESPLHLTLIHDLYCVQALTGGAEPIGFDAQLRFAAGGACDLAVVQLTWPDGLVASLTASFLTPPGMPTDGFDRMEVFGDGWAARIQSNPRPIDLWDDRARWPLTLEIRSGQADPSGMLTEELRTFSRVVRGTEAVPLGARYHDGLQVQRWLERLESGARKTAAVQPL